MTPRIRSPRIIFVALASCAASSLARASDLPGFGTGVKTRVMIQFDNSRSMLLAPDPVSIELGDLSHANDDYDPDNNPGGSCQNKLCIGKRAMSGVLSGYGSLLEMGLATYYQFERSTLIPSGGGWTQCSYDVLAAPGEVHSFRSYNDLGATVSCTPTNCVNPPPYDRYTCTRVGTDYDFTQWYSSAHGSTVGVSSYVDNNRTWTLDSTVQEPPGPPWNRFRVQKNPDCPTPPTYDAMYLETNRFGCSAASPCEMYYRDQVVTGTTLSQVSYQNRGSSYAVGSTIYSLAGSSTEEWALGSPTCRPSYTETTSAVPGCSASNPCDLAYLRTDTSTITDTQIFYTDRGASTTIGTRSYTRSGAIPQSPFEVQRTLASPNCNTSGYLETSNWGCSASNPCQMNYLGTRVVLGEIGQQFCQYSRTQYIYTATITSSSCIYQRSIYNYVAPGPDQTWCEYARYAYNFKSPVYTYQWLTYGGEIVDSTRLSADAINYWCGSPYASGYGANHVCPPSANNIGAPCSGGRQCSLTWRQPSGGSDGGSDAGVLYAQGRNSYYLGSDFTTPSFCLAVDRPDGGIPQPDPGPYYSDWCQGSGSILTQVIDTRQVTDYYDPPTANPPGAGFPMDHKYSGWSRSEDGTQKPSLVFVPIDGGTLPEMLQAMKKWYGPDAIHPNPIGIRTSNNDVYQDFTPLYGSAKNAYSYFASLMASDPSAACRPYYYVVITDGQEYTPINYTPAQLQGAIASLRSIPVPGIGTKDVKTFVIGFGSQAVGGALDLMARAGGTAVDPVTLGTDLVNGVALSAMDEGALTDALNLVFSYLAAGTFSRSKPLLAMDGSRVYAAYFKRLPNTQEWTGGLATYNVDGAGAVSSMLWDYGIRINTQSTRTIYTQVPSNSGLIYFDTTASGANYPTDQANLYTGMGVDPVAGDQVITFLRNLSLAERFQDGSVKTSRASDIYHSGPAIVGTANHNPTWAGPDLAQQAAFSAYKATTAAREITLYVGANDGMLHAIREDAAAHPASWAGTERWALVPPPVFSRLADNRIAHTFSVDGSLGIEDVCFGTCDVPGNWRTLLIGALREGGPALYALDVTDPSRPAYLWTFYDGNLGDTYSAPVVAKIRVDLTGSLEDRWVAMLGGGVSSVNNSGDYFYLLDARTGAILQDSTATQARYQVGVTGIPQKNNIAARVSVYRPEDGPYATTVYFGDTQGRINRVDLTSGSLPSMRPVRFFDPTDINCRVDTAGHANAPILRAADDVQVGTLPFPNLTDSGPIYERAVVAKDRVGRRMIFVGTGDFTNPVSTNDVNYFYALRDSDTGAVCSGIPAWIKQFSPGEKVLADPVVIGTTVILSTYKPPSGGISCTNAGSATLYAYEMANGHPAPILSDGRGHDVSTLTIPDTGIISDLLVSGNSLVFNTSNDPTLVQTVRLTISSSMALKSWWRMR